MLIFKIILSNLGSTKNFRVRHSGGLLVRLFLHGLLKLWLTCVLELQSYYLRESVSTDGE